MISHSYQMNNRQKSYKTKINIYPKLKLSVISSAKKIDEECNNISEGIHCTMESYIDPNFRTSHQKMQMGSPKYNKKNLQT